MSAAEELKAQARVFARAQQRVELATLLSNPFQRPAGWAIPIAGLPITVLLWPMAAEVWPALPAVAWSYLLAVALVFAAWLLTGQILERHAFQHAPYRWLTRRDGADVAGAYAQLDRKHRLTLHSVWANPQGHGHGAALLRQIIADTAPHDLWLVADNRRGARFYQRHGFQPVRRELLGHRMLLARSGGREQRERSNGRPAA
ncbi:MAG TPA: GNAT family N-acetyltransferase [Microlunatus sp.]